MAERFIFYLFILITVRVPLNSGIINSFCEISCSTMWLAAARLWVISIQLIRNSKHPWIGCFTDIHIFFSPFLWRLLILFEHFAILQPQKPTTTDGYFNGNSWRRYHEYNEYRARIYPFSFCVQYKNFHLLDRLLK